MTGFSVPTGPRRQDGGAGPGREAGRAAERDGRELGLGCLFQNGEQRRLGRRAAQDEIPVVGQQHRPGAALAAQPGTSPAAPAGSAAPGYSWCQSMMNGYYGGAGG